MRLRFAPRLSRATFVALLFAEPSVDSPEGSSAVLSAPRRRRLAVRPLATLAPLAWLAAALASLAGCQLSANHQNISGVQLFRQGRFDAAAMRFQDAMSTDPTNADAFYNLAATYHRMGIIACRYRAAEWHHKEIELAAHDLLQYLDASRSS